MMFQKLICFCLLVTIVRTDLTDEISSSIDTTPTTSNSVAQNLEELKKDAANPKHNAIYACYVNSLFRLGSSENILDVHTGAGKGHGRGGYGDMDQGIVGKPAGVPLSTTTPVIHNFHGIHNIYGTLDPTKTSSTQITLRIIYACSLYASRNVHQRDLQRINLPPCTYLDFSCRSH
ncbi:uncharacterized protein LOC124369717 [Homalodisca vitripennis]|uniref:uncharacterized protein LOC124369717 n=1 Tax=Homalodisca vitripennis TaxID=197043 RepID=UPI001EECB44D|nr:uncharacterized protein LOC124369717 [Homalodisca vitripennis]